MTDTTTTPDLASDRLTLVRLDRAYLATSEAYAEGLEALRDVVESDDDERLLFYAVPQPSYGPGWARLIVADSDPRSEGMTRDHGGTLEALGLDPDTHRGWNLERRHIHPVTPGGRPAPASASLSGEARSHMPAEEAYPVGTVWHHYNAGEAEVIGHNGTSYVRVRQGEPDREWVRGALDLESTTFVRWADSAPEVPPPTTVPTGDVVTREEAERMVSDARAEVRAEAERRFESWKANATEIAHRYANDNSLCSQFDRCMVDIGLEPRESFQREYAVSITETRTYRVYVEATDEDNAAEIAEERVRYAYESPDDVTTEVVDVEED
jgi:hypothetical protein